MIDPRLFQILRCPCSGYLSDQRDAIACETCGNSYKVENGIPRFASLPDERQEQVRATFGYKWQRAADWGMSGETKAHADQWNLKLLGWRDEHSYQEFLSSFDVILDAGCGNGRELIRIARLNPRALVIGMDISEAVDVASRNAAGLPNTAFIQGDILRPPLAPRSVHYISSLGVLHHTPSTRAAVSSLLSSLMPGGEFAFAVYVRKAPIREFTDDYVRSAIRNLPPEQAWQEMESITLFGKALSDLHVTIEVPDVPVLGILGGRHNLQRMLYYTMLKCYWRDGISFEDNVHVNFDWYYPQYAWRHTPDEVRSWFAELGLHETAFVLDDAQIGFRVRVPERSNP